MNTRLISGLIALFFTAAVAHHAFAESPYNGASRLKPRPHVNDPSSPQNFRVGATSGLSAESFLAKSDEAERESNSAKADEDDVLDDIRTQMLSAARKNNIFAEENKELKAQLISLQLEVKQYEQDIAVLDPEYIKNRERSSQSEAIPAGWNSAEDDDLIREAQNIYLTGQSMRLDESQKLRELQLYDLQYEKQERQLDLKSVEFVYEKVRDQRRTELEGLQAEVRANETKVKATELKIAQQEKAALSYPQRIDLLKMENKALKQKIKQLQELLK